VRRALCLAAAIKVEDNTVARRNNDMDARDPMEDTTDPPFFEGGDAQFDVGYAGDGSDIEGPDGGGDFSDDAIDMRSNGSTAVATRRKPAAKAQGSPYGNKPAPASLSGDSRTPPKKNVVALKPEDIPEGVTFVAGKPVMKQGRNLSADELAAQLAMLKKLEQDNNRAVARQAAEKERAAKKKADEAAKKKADEAAKAKQKKADADKAKIEGAKAIVPVLAQDSVLSMAAFAGSVWGPMSLTLPESITVNKWKTGIETLVLMANRSPWYVGDALVFGKEHFGSMYENTAKQLGMDIGTLRNYKQVCELFPPEARVEGLTFKHHAEVAALFRKDPATAMNMLEEALKKDWPATQLRANVDDWEKARTRAARPEGEEDEDGTPRTKQKRGPEPIPFEVELSQMAHDEAIRFEDAVKNNEEISERNRYELGVFIELCKTNETVSSAAALRTMARLALDAEREKLRADGLMVALDKATRTIERWETGDLSLSKPPVKHRNTQVTE
jgi:hypothetical protein